MLLGEFKGFVAVGNCEGSSPSSGQSENDISVKSLSSCTFSVTHFQMANIELQCSQFL